MIVLSFVHLFPQQGNGFPGTNFGNQCSGSVYPGPGYGGVNNTANNHLLICPDLQRALNTCRATSSKKILLSLGGGTDAYQLTGAADGANLAILLWGMFGPRQAAVQNGLPRPFDYGTASFSVDGFDLDIEHAAPDAAAVGYKALVAQLRSLFSQARTPFYLTASPQCVVPDANEGQMIAATAFDMLFIQFYNTPQCSARTWANANPSYSPGAAAAAGVNTAGFTYDAWTAWLANTASRNAKLFIGIPGSASAAAPGNDVTVAQAANLANAYYCRANFGGISIWEATYAAGNVLNGKTFYQNMKAALTADSAAGCSSSVKFSGPQGGPIIPGSISASKSASSYKS